MKPFEAIIFDCDGVLFKSHQANLAYYNRIFAHLGQPAVTDPLSADAMICHTASSPVVFEKLLGAELVSAALDFAASLDYREFIPLMIEELGLKDALTRLAERYPLAVATNRGTSMPEVLKHFGLDQHFSAIVTSRDVERPKPAPDMLHLAAKRLGVTPEGCLFVGDSELDYQAAVAAPMHFVGFGNQFEGKRSVSSHTELADWVMCA